MNPFAEEAGNEDLTDDLKCLAHENLDGLSVSHVAKKIKQRQRFHQTEIICICWDK
mgnify:CR=1 FL=1